MWYVIQVMACHESEMVTRCRQIIKDGEEVFTMMTERQERRNGQWQPKQFVTFQKYIFVDTDDPDDFRIRLHDVIGMTKMLGIGDDIIPISPEEEGFLKRIGGEDHIIGRISAFCEGDKVSIMTGPFAGMEGCVEWTDKRQRLIGIRVGFMNRETVIKLGAEFIRKE